MSSLIKINDWLVKSEAKLKDVGISSARLDCLIFLEDLLARDRIYILTHLENALTVAQIKQLDQLTKLRLSHKPIAYIRGKSEFYGLNFSITEDTLIPRPESEGFLNLLKSSDIYKTDRLIDIGTGSGCLGIAIKLNFPFLDVTLLDKSKSALKVAKNNANVLVADVSIVNGDLLSKYNDPFSIAVANLPYVPPKLPINLEAKHEPQLAIYGQDNDGLGYYRKLFSQISNLFIKPRLVLTESLDSQHPALITLAKKVGYELLASDSLVQLYIKRS